MAVSVCSPPFTGEGMSPSSMTGGRGRSLVGFTSMNASDRDEELAIRITIPPKPDGMNPGPYPNGQAGPQSATFTISASPSQRDTEDNIGVSSSLVTATGGIGLKSLLNQEEDLASSKLPFVWKLYEMLEDVEINDQQDIVSWVEDGKAFKVHKMKAFVDEIIPKYFRQSKYKSFQRQLYFYDFHRVPGGPNAGAYSHPKFQKGVKTLCLSMMPKKTARRRSGKSKAIDDDDSSHQESTADPEEPRQRVGDPSRWLPDHESHSSRGPDPRSSSPLALQHRSSVSDDECVPTRVPSLERSGPNDGDIVFVFGGRPFHYVEAVFDDIYPPSSSYYADYYHSQRDAPRRYSR